MATVRKRGKSYQIRVSCGYDIAGKQIVKTLNWTPPDGLGAVSYTHLTLPTKLEV